MGSNHQPRVLCLTHQRAVRHRICAQLAQEGFAVLVEPPDGDLRPIVDIFHPDLMITDIGDIEYRLIHHLLENGGSPPVIMLGDGDTTSEAISAAWRNGAHDVLVEPIDIDELAGTIRILLDHVADRIFGVDDLAIDEDGVRVSRNGDEVALTKTEFRLLVTLVRHHGIVLSKRQLLANVWGFDDYDENLVEVHVSALRRKLEHCGPRMIHTVRGIGYVIRGNRWGRYQPPSRWVADLI